MEKQNTQIMSFEQFLRGSLNTRSEKAPKSLSEAIQDPNLPQEIKLFYGGTLKNRLDSLDALSQGIMLGSSDESFSIGITEEQEMQVDELTRQFYNGAGYELYKKDSLGLSDSYFFRNNSGDIIIVTYSLPLYNESDKCLVSATKVNFGERREK